MDADLPEAAAKSGLTKSLSMQTVQDVVGGIRGSSGDSLSLRIRALGHYAEFDAFMPLDH